MATTRSVSLLIGDAQVERSRGTGVYRPFDDNSLGTGDGVETRNRCAYNKTRGYILGIEVACGDFTSVNLAERLPMLAPKSGGGLWMVPFRGLSEDVPVPLDLIYLDSNRRVIETVEFFPTFRVSPSSPAASSLLALPIHSIFASHTQPGDQIAFGQVEDVEQELAALFGSGAAANAAQEALGARREPAESVAASPAKEPLVASAPPRDVVHPVQHEAPGEVKVEAERPEPKLETPKKKKSWLQKLLGPAEPVEPRRNVRETLPGLTAYFFTGATPVAHPVRDISASGLFVVTDERWYPGTLVQMTLKKTEEGMPRTEYSISLTVKALRWGNDGVGVAFVLRDPRNITIDSIHAQGATREEMDVFLQRIGLKQS